MRFKLKAVIFLSLLFVVDSLLLGAARANPDLVYSLYPSVLIPWVRLILGTLTLSELAFVYLAAIGEILLANTIANSLRRRFRPPSSPSSTADNDKIIAQ